MGKDESNLLRNCEIEVSSDEDGLKGAWFKAILEDDPKRRKKKLNVRYSTLQANNGSPLLETAYRKFIRPVPPENLFSTGDFEEGSVVEAAHRDGWWTGLFVKKLDDDKHLVFFDSPPDLIQFKRKQLRQHFKWTKGKWIKVKPQNKEVSNNSSFSCGTMVEVKVKWNGVMWIPAIVVKETDNGRTFIVKSCKYLSWNDETKPNRTVSSRSIRPVPDPFCVETYALNEAVEVFTDPGPGWRLGRVQRIFWGKKYTVRLDATNELVVFQHSDLRPSVESVSERFMQMPTEVNPAVFTPQRSLSPVENGEADISEDETVATSEPSLAQGSGNEMVDDVRNDSGTSDINATPTKQTEDIAQGEKSSHEKTLEPMPNENGLGDESSGEKSGEVSLAQESGDEMVDDVINDSGGTPTKQTEDKAQGKTSHEKTLEQMSNEDVLGKDSTMEKESIEDNSRKRKREENLSATANVEEETGANDTTTMVLPFEKKLPIWKKFESMEAFKTFPQRPHFRPLMETQEDYREMTAVGMMCNYAASLEQVKSLQLLTPISTLEGLKDSFAFLEKNGFDVEEPQSRIQKLLSLKDWQAKKMEELKGVEKEIAEKESENDEIEQKILELQRMKEEANKEIDQMKSRKATIEQELEDVELQF